MTYHLISVNKKTYESYEGDKIEASTMSFDEAKDLLEGRSPFWVVGTDELLALQDMSAPIEAAYMLSPIFRKNVLRKLASKSYEVQSDINFSVMEACFEVCKHWKSDPNFEVPLTINLFSLYHKVEDSIKQGHLPNIDHLVLSEEEIELINRLIEETMYE